MQNTDSIRIEKVITETKLSVDSAKYYCQQMQQLLRKMKKEKEKQKP